MLIFQSIFLHSTTIYLWLISLTASKELLALIGNRSVLFDFDDFEDDENESYHKNMFESDDIEGGENL